MSKEYDAVEGEDNVYSGDGREDALEEGSISPEEEAFMKGYDEAEDEDDQDKEEE